MNFLPVAFRELQVAARKPMTYYWRSLSALNAACLTLGFLLVGFSGALSASSAGEMTFQILAGAGYVFAAIAAVLGTADCISEERREGTLGFLFLTDLKGYDVILGKLARLIGPAFGLVAAFPALGFTMLLGGVSMGNFAKVALSLANTLFFFSALGLLVSARSLHGRGAVSVAMAGFLVFTGPMAAAILGVRFSGIWQALLVVNPAGAFLSALMDAGSKVSRPDFFLSLMLSHALGWVLIVLAGLMVTRTFSDEETRPLAARQPRSVLGSNPSLALHAIGQQRSWRLVSMLAVLVALVAITARLISPKGWFDIPTFVCVVLGLHTILKYWAAHSACNSLPSRRHNGELEILLTTPLDGDAILLGSTTVIKFQLLRPFLFVAAMDALMLLLAWHKLGLWAGFGFAGVMLIEFLWFIGNLYTLTWVGLWMGLKYPSHAKALGRTLLYIIILPWSFLAVAAAFVGVTTMGHSLSPLTGMVTVAEFVVALAVCNLGFAGWAVSELRDHFRLLAASQALPAQKTDPPWKPILDRLRFRCVKPAPQTI